MLAVGAPSAAAAPPGRSSAACRRRGARLSSSGEPPSPGRTSAGDDSPPITTTAAATTATAAAPSAIRPSTGRRTTPGREIAAGAAAWRSAVARGGPSGGDTVGAPSSRTRHGNCCSTLDSPAGVRAGDGSDARRGEGRPSADAKTPAALGAQPMRRTSRVRLASAAYRRLISPGPECAPGVRVPGGRCLLAPPIGTTHRRVRRRWSRLRRTNRGGGASWGGPRHDVLCCGRPLSCRRQWRDRPRSERGYLRMVRRFMTRFGVALSVAAVVLSLGASAAFGGEITGNGKTLQIALRGQQVGHGPARSVDVPISGQEDDQFVDGRLQGRDPAHAQSWGQIPKDFRDFLTSIGANPASPATRRRASRSSGATLSDVPLSAATGPSAHAGGPVPLRGPCPRSPRGRTCRTSDRVAGPGATGGHTDAAGVGRDWVHGPLRRSHSPRCGA